MRECRFRAWDKKSKKMRMVESIGFGAISIYEKGYPVCNMLGYDIINQKPILIHRDSPHFELMQFTGKQDKNENDIYDSDIVKCYAGTDANGDDLYLFYKVVWHDIYHCWRLSSLCANEDKYLHEYNSNNIEVIGNIYENPELVSSIDANNNLQVPTMKINMKKLEQYLKDGKIIEFNSDQECMEYFNTYDYQCFTTIDELKVFQDRYGFNIGERRYHINYDEALDVWDTESM